MDGVAAFPRGATRFSCLRAKERIERGSASFHSKPGSRTRAEARVECDMLSNDQPNLRVRLLSRVGRGCGVRAVAQDASGRGCANLPF